MQGILFLTTDVALSESVSVGLETPPGGNIFRKETALSTVKALESGRFDVVIIDIDALSPGQELDLVRLMKTVSPRVQILVLASKPEITCAVEAMRSGAFDYIDKSAPTMEELLRPIRRALRFSNGDVDRDSLFERLLLSCWNSLATARKGKGKGDALEVFCVSLFRTIPGWEEITRNTRTSAEELDLIIFNESRDEFWRHFGSVILVECKNWTKKPGTPELNHFKAKLQARRGGSKLGFFVSPSGFSSGFKTMKGRAAGDGSIVVELDRLKLRDLVYSGDRGRMLKNHVAQSMVE